MHIGESRPLKTWTNRVSGKGGPGFHPAVPFGMETDMVRFSGSAGVVKSRKVHVARNALATIEQRLAEDRPLTRRDNAWVRELNDMLGQDRPMRLTHPERPGKTIRLDGRLTVRAINRNRKAILGQLRDTLHAMLAAEAYRPVIKHMKNPVDGEYRLTIHNPELVERLKPGYSSREFAALLDLCREKGVFDLNIDPHTGLVKTAGIEESEDAIMSQGWVTDTVRNGLLQKDLDPAAWRRALETLAEFYENERAAFEQVFKDPVSYRRPDTGVHHMFDPQTRTRYPWLSSKRLESHGLALQAFCETALEDEGKISEAAMVSIAQLSRYFAAIDYPTAPTIGAWEELTFDGLTSDVEIIRSAYEKLHELLYDPALEIKPGIAALREKLQQPPYSDLIPGPQELNALIEKGHRKVAARVLDKAPTEHPERPADAGLAFVTTSTIRFSNDPAEDVAAHLNILRYLGDTVVGDNGVIRYQPFHATVRDGKTERSVRTFDGYLTPNWGLAADNRGRLSLYKEAYHRKFGYPLAHLSPSTPEGFTARASYAEEPGKEAEWFMIGEIARGYALQAGKILDVLASELRPPTDRERELLDAAMAGATEAMNRSLARITGESPEEASQMKANGKPCPRWAVPEAYQHVSTFDGGTRMVPGVNTPLAWAASSLYGAARDYLQVLQRMERLGLA